MVVNTKMDSMYLENLDEFINDEGKIVTYKWLSLTLDVPANVAKQMLYQFVQEQRNKDNDSLNVTYLLSGVADGEQGKVHKVMVVREENLEVVKRTLKEIISVHVYSVTKSKLSDLATLYTANYDITKSNLTSITKHSGIECSTAKVRSADDLIKLQKQQAYQPIVEVSILPPKTKVSPKKEIVNKPAAAKGKSNQIANMFSKQTKKEDTKSEIKSEKDTSKPSKPSAAASKNKGAGISSFFTKGGPTVAKPTSKSPESVLSTPKSESSETDNDAATPTIKTEKKEKKEIKDEPSEEMDTDESPVVKAPIKTEIKKEVKNESPKKEIKKETKKEFGNSKTKSKVSKKRKTLSEDPQPKKRSRIMQMSDSESSDGEQEESDEESPFPPNHEPEKARIDSDSEDEVIPSTPEKEDKSDTRGRKKKLVDKTYMDEDGFLVTKKEYEFVDGSEDEKETKSNVEAETKSKESPKKVEEQPKKSEPSPVKKNKQANIMSFFKKK